jgi:hypothetical protein
MGRLISKQTDLLAAKRTPSNGALSEDFLLKYGLMCDGFDV